MESTETVTSTSSAPPASSATSTSTTSSSPTPTTDRPSFGDALSVFNEAAKAQGKKTYGATTTATPLAAQPATVAEGTVVDPNATTTTTTTPGPIPLTVHQQALANARAKERQAVEQEYRTKYGDPAAVAALLPYAQQFQTDRRGFIARIVNEALQDPELAPEMLSLAGRTLRGSTPQTQTPAEAPPPDFTDGQGNQFYSARAQQARDAWLIAQLREQILGEVAPKLEQVDTVAQREAQREQAQQLATWRDSTLTKARQLPYFKEHEADIKAAYLAMPATSGHPAEEAAALRDAYDRVVLPKLQQLEQDRVLAQLKTRASASTLNPAATGAPGGVPKAVRAKDGGSMRAALKWAEAQQTGR